MPRIRHDAIAAAAVLAVIVALAFVTEARLNRNEPTLPPAYDVTVRP